MDPQLILIFIFVAVSVALVGFLGLRTRSRRPGRGPVEAPERREPLPKEPEEDGRSSAPSQVSAPQGPAPVLHPVPPAQAPAPPAEKAPAPSEPGGRPPTSTAPAEVPATETVSRMSRGLAKTRGVLGRTLSVVTRAERLDAEDWEDVEAALISADVGVKATARILDSLQRTRPKPSTLSSALKDELLQVLCTTERALRDPNGERPAVWLVTGVNGVGKTTTIAKLAHYMNSQGRSVVLAAGDTFRAAAIDQLGAWADRIGVHMVRHAAGADPGAVVFDAIEHARAKGVDLVIVDTAGRLHTKSNLMEELKKVHRIAMQQAKGVAEVLLVLDATVGQNGIAQAQTFKEAVGVTGLILAKLDGSAKGGVAVAVEEELGIPVKMVGVGEGLEDLELFDPSQFVAALIGDR